MDDIRGSQKAPTSKRGRPAKAVAAFTVGKLEGLSGFAVRLIHQHLSTGLNEVLAHENVRPHQFTALSLIVDNPSMSQNALAKALGIKPSNMVPLIDEMEARDLVRREAGSVGRRSYALVATTQGRRTRSRILALVADYENISLKDITQAEREALTSVARKLGGFTAQP